MKLTEREEQKRQAHNLLYAPLQEEPIDLDQIFQVMVESLRYHYAGYEQKRRYFTPSEYRTYILSRHRYNTLTFRMLARSLHQFAADMHDRNLRFSCDDWIDYRNTDVRFRVRAQEDCLWVTEAAAETGLVPGDKILTVNRMTNRVYNLNGGRPVFYMSRTLKDFWERQLLTNHYIEKTIDQATRTITTSYKGIPIHLDDMILDTEERVA